MHNQQKKASFIEKSKVKVQKGKAIKKKQYMQCKVIEVK